MVLEATAAANEVLFDVQDHVGLITLNAPDRLNAISAGMAQTIIDLLADARRRDEIRALVLTGAGRAFCAGAHLGRNEKLVTGRDSRKFPVRAFAALTRAIVDVDKPVIAAVHGPAVGAGLSYAMACDRRIGDPTSRMSAIFIKRGLHPDCGASFFLPRLVGLPRALQMVSTGEMLDAQAAKEAGLLDEIVAQGETVAAALAYAGQLASGPSVALELARRSIYLSLSSTLDQALYYEGFATGAVGQTADHAEGIAAFLERRTPNFRGE
jgi:2-(1,2-epoxy-1,2-dihydrophenyl)acetyl-CoA isomerase